MPMPDGKLKVFISYSHADRKWLERLKVHLVPLQHGYDIDVWEDTRVRPGAKWRDEIRDAVGGANVAVLIVSADFLASEFIKTNELPPLLKAAEEEGALILPIIAGPSLYGFNPELAQFQAVNTPSGPLVSLSSGEQEDVFVRVALAILQRASTVSRDLHDGQTGDRKLRENFLERAIWNQLVKIGDWLFDADNKQILGSGMNAYLLSRMEYGKIAAIVHTSLRFSNLHEHPNLKMNAGIVFGWNSDKTHPQYYNILLTGEDMLIERIGFKGGEASRDYAHIVEAVPFPIREDCTYNLTLSLNPEVIDVMDEHRTLLSLRRPTGVSGRVGLRPWRSQMSCTKFIVHSM